jgi:hypothetical protein
MSGLGDVVNKFLVKKLFSIWHVGGSRKGFNLIFSPNKFKSGIV